MILMVLLEKYYSAMGIPKQKFLEQFISKLIVHLEKEPVWLTREDDQLSRTPD